MTWNPESEDISQSFDLTENIVKTLDSHNKFKGSNGAAVFPEIAPLVFPALDRLQDQQDPQATGMKNKLKREQAWVDEYWDRRATAVYVSSSAENLLYTCSNQTTKAADHPNSMLASSVPTPKFASRYADPTHAASSGDLIGLITGGRLSSGGGVQGVVGKISGQPSNETSGPTSSSEASSGMSRGLDVKKFMGQVSYHKVFLICCMLLIYPNRMSCTSWLSTCQTIVTWPKQEID
jgi:hypothetical protein